MLAARKCGYTSLEYSGVAHMSRRLLRLGIAITMGSATLSLPAFSQAIAESVTLGASTSSAAAKGGTALSSVLNQTSNRIAGRVQQQVSRQPETKTAKTQRILTPRNQTARAESRSLSQPGAMIVSIQGAEPNCSVTKQAPAPQDKAAAGRSTKCDSNASVRPEAQKYNSVVTISSPK